MLSSTSSFKRATPRINWPVSGAIAVVIFLVAMTAWEFKVRSWGYGPTLNDTSDLWASVRSRITDDPNQVVIVGSSRIQFDFNLETWVQRNGGEPPVQLAMPGTNPMPLLEDIAASEFRGKLILGVTPGLWFVPQGPPVELAENSVGRFRNWSPSQRAGVRLGMVLQNRLAFINADDLTLGSLVGRYQMSNRPGVAPNLPPVLPPYFALTDGHRQAAMWDQCNFDTPLAQKIQQIWLPLFTPPPPPPHLSPEEFQGMLAGNMEAHLGRLGAAVKTIKDRGGKVVLVRCPSRGPLRELEAKFSPRVGFWDRMLEVTSAPGIHFEDHAELAAFDCPEWSHLTAEDAVRYSKVVMPMVEAALAD